MELKHIRSKKRLAEIWCILNNWKWPKEFKKEESKRGEYMKQITERIGLEKCLAEWNNPDRKW